MLKTSVCCENGEGSEGINKVTDEKLKEEGPGVVEGLLGQT